MTLTVLLQKNSTSPVVEKTIEAPSQPRIVVFDRLAYLFSTTSNGKPLYVSAPTFHVESGEYRNALSP